MKKLGFKESFLLYIHIDHKQSENLVKRLAEQCFKANVKDVGDDHEVSVIIKPVRAAEVISIFNLFT